MRNTFTFLICILLMQNSFGQIKLDLAKYKPGEKYSQTIEPQTIDYIKLENTLINKKYSLNIKVEKIIDYLPTDWLLPDKVDSIKKKCPEEDNLYSRMNGLIDEKKESEISDHIKIISKLLENRKLVECLGVTKIDSIRKIAEQTTKTYPVALPIELKDGEILTISVTRDTLNWVYTFKTKTESPWDVMYGFTYVSNWLNPTKNYFAKADTGKSFIVTEQNKQSSSNSIFKNITPTIMFTYKPLKKYTWKEKWLHSIFNNRIYQFGFTGGISLDLNNPTAMVSPSIIFADNLSLNFGLVFTQKDVLNGMYKEGDRIFENMTFGQLHEKKYMPELFVSIAFRFEKNIFQKKEKDDVGVAK